VRVAGLSALQTINAIPTLGIHPRMRDEARLHFVLWFVVIGQDPTYPTPCYGTIWTPDGLASVSRYSIASDGMQSVSANCCAFIQYKFARMNVHGFV
jgi:hypothetical protein